MGKIPCSAIHCIIHLRRPDDAGPHRRQRSDSSEARERQKLDAKFLGSAVKIKRLLVSPNTGRENKMLLRFSLVCALVGLVCRLGRDPTYKLPEEEITIAEGRN